MHPHVRSRITYPCLALDKTHKGDSQLPTYVDAVYKDIIADLGLNTAEVPLLVGEVLLAPRACSANHNAAIANR